MESGKGEHRRVIPIKTLLAELASIGGHSASLRSFAIQVAGASDPRYGERMVERLFTAGYARLVGHNERGMEAMSGWVIMTDAGWARHKQFQAMGSAHPHRGTRPVVPAVSGSLNGRKGASGT